MTSWIWMKGVKEAVADPCPPVTEFDQRPSVKELITKHTDVIAKVRAELEEDSLYDSDKHDDLWILRFVLSHKAKVPKAVAAAKSTLQFRDKHNLDDKDLRSESWSRDSSDTNVQKYFKHMTDEALILVLPDARRGVVMYFDLSGFDYPNMLEDVSEDEWLGAFIFANEWSHQWQDYITRTTGRLTKSVRLMDTSTFRMSMLYREANRRDGNCMGIMEDCYPQLLQAFYVCNAPVWIQVPWRIIKHIFPKRVVEKFDMMNPAKSERERTKVFGYIDEKDLPVKFGGKHEPWPPQYEPPVVKR